MLSTMCILLWLVPGQRPAGRAAQQPVRLGLRLLSPGTEGKGRVAPARGRRRRVQQLLERAARPRLRQHPGRTELPGVPPANAPLAQAQLGPLAARTAAEAGLSCQEYLTWVGPYLYYFDFYIDQRFFARPKDRRLLMLIPQGAKRPTVFQRRFEIGPATYVSNPEVFYAPPRP